MTETIHLLSYHYGAGFSRVLLNFTFSKYNLDGELTKMFCYSVCMTIICTEICCSTPFSLLILLKITLLLARKSDVCFSFMNKHIQLSFW